MCLIFMRNVGVTITEKWLRDVWVRNSHGWGMTWQTGQSNEMGMLKGMQFEEFLKNFNDLQDSDIPVMVHMRMATHGGKTQANLHPFSLHDGGPMFLMHNGITHHPSHMDDGRLGTDAEDDDMEAYVSSAYGGNGWSRYNQGASDTRAFVERFMKPMLNRMSYDEAMEHVRSPGFGWMMSKLPGSNFMVISDPMGHVVFDDGAQRGGLLESVKDPWLYTTTNIPVSNYYAFSLDQPSSKWSGTYGGHYADAGYD